MASIEVLERGGRVVCRLIDESSGASAMVLPSYGFNLFDLRLPVGGLSTPILSAAADFADNPSHPARSGIPILFPYPNRVRNGRFQFAGRDFQLPITNGPNAIHGFALEADWDVVEQTSGPDGAYLTGRFQISRQTPQHRDSWPADAVLEVRYGLLGRRLTMDVTVANPSATNLPYGFGVHPYFFLPFTPDGDPAGTQVVLPASTYWELQDSLPTGLVRPVDDRLDFRKGQPRRGLELDDVLSGLAYQEGEWGVCRLIDSARSAQLRIGFDRGFRELVVFTPKGRDNVIAVEPYTQTTDAVNLQPQGRDAGLRVLPPGQSEYFRLFFETLG